MKVWLVSFAAGCFGGCCFVAALLMLDIGGLGTLIARDQGALVPLLLLLTAVAGSFGVAMAVSSVAEEQPPRGGRLQRRALPVRASAAACRLQSPNR